MALADRFAAEPSALSPSFFPTTWPVVVGRVEMDELISIAGEQGGVARLCLHSSPDDPVHAMIIAQRGEHYWRPKKHLTKAKFYQVLVGRIAVVIFTEYGERTEVITLDPAEAPFLTVPPGQFHTNVALESETVYHETVPGPYRPGEKDRVPAPWAPDEKEQANGAAYLGGLLADRIPSRSPDDAG